MGQLLVWDPAYPDEKRKIFKTFYISVDGMTDTHSLECVFNNEQHSQDFAGVIENALDTKMQVLFFLRKERTALEEHELDATVAKYLNSFPTFLRAVIDNLVATSTMINDDKIKKEREAVSHGYY